MSDITRSDIVNEARTWLGTRFHHQGRLKGVGVDCVGLPICVGNTLGLHEPFDYDGYGRQPEPRVILSHLRRMGIRIPISEMLPGDVLLMCFEDTLLPTHLAIVTDRGIIHSYVVARRCVEHALTDEWRARIHSAWRWRGID